LSPNVEIQYRFSGGDTDATLASARELIGLRPAVIVANSNTSMAALHREATSIPVVFLNVSDPVGMGYLNSLSRPGRSVTGLTPFVPSLGGKWLSFLRNSRHQSKTWASSLIPSRATTLDRSCGLSKVLHHHSPADRHT
jgi:putative tryptophan/tyrosine transport system substrate-binding protein